MTDLWCCGPACLVTSSPRRSPTPESQVICAASEAAGSRFFTSHCGGSATGGQANLRMQSSRDMLTYLANNFHIDAVRIQHIRRVIIRVIVRSNARCAVVDSAGRDRGSMEVIDEGASMCNKRNVCAKPRCFLVVDPHAGIAVFAKAVPRSSRTGLFRSQGQDASNTKRGEGTFVEISRYFSIANSELDVVDDGHGFLNVERGRGRFWMSAR